MLFLTDKNDTANDCDDCDTDDDGEHEDTDNKVEYGFIYMEECGNHEDKNDNIDNGDNTIQMMIVILAIMIIMFFVTISIRRHRRWCRRCENFEFKYQTCVKQYNRDLHAHKTTWFTDAK